MSSYTKASMRIYGHLRAHTCTDLRAHTRTSSPRPNILHVPASHRNAARKLYGAFKQITSGELSTAEFDEAKAEERWVPTRSFAQRHSQNVVLK